MRKTASIILGVSSATLLLGSLFTAPAALADEEESSVASRFAVCKDTKNPPTDAVDQGGCIVINRTKGNCHACHKIEGMNYGDIAPPLIAMKARFPDKAKLRAQVWDATVANPNSVMSPFGRHGILSEDEIDKVVEFLLTL